MVKSEKAVLVLQGGGALGAYQAGTFDYLSTHGWQPDWVAGISIGAINASIICGNPPATRLSKLREFWEEITSGVSAAPWLTMPQARQIYGEIAATAVLAGGVPGFFKPKPMQAFLPFAVNPTLSYYDTRPLRHTLEAMVDFDYLNDKGPRLSVGAVDVETANFAYFDSHEILIGPEHIMASGALPPGFPPIEIKDRHYWDGGLVSNTPLQFVMDNLGRDPVCIFQVDVFSARGKMPTDLGEVAGREKDIRFSSRTRLTTDRYRDLHKIRAAVHRLGSKLPPELQDDPDVAFLRSCGPVCPITLVHLIHRPEPYEGQAKDYEFSRLTMNEHWDVGRNDVRRSFNHKSWIDRKVGQDGLQVLDLTKNARTEDEK